MYYLLTFSKLTAIENSLFALSWVIMGLILPFFDDSIVKSLSLEKVVWIALAFFTARSLGMSLNRLIDWSIDAKNPRTKDRLLPKGELSAKQVITTSVICFLIFFYAMRSINTTCFFLSIPITCLITLYSYTKRYTYFCHFVLGLVQFCVPIAAFAALTDQITLAPLFLGLSLLFLITASDITYALQDEEFDRSNGLYSIPAVFGRERAFKFAKALNGLSLFTLLALGYVIEIVWVYHFSILFIAVLHLYYYAKIERGKSIEKAFFRSTTLSGLILLAAITGGLIWKQLL